MLDSLKKEGRIEAIDFVKLFASILVIIGHSMMKYIENGTSNPLFNFIWLTQMPLFMFASGFINVKCENCKTFTLYLYKMLRNVLILLVPCLSFLLISSAITGTSVVKSFINFYKNPESNLWFLWVLFMIHMLFDFGLYLSCKIKNKFNFLLPVFLSMMVAIFIAILMLFFKHNFDFSILSIKLLAYYLPFYCFGYLFRFFIKSNCFEHKMSKILFYITVCITFLILLFECFYFKSIYSFDDFNVKHLLLRVLGSFSSIIVIVFISSLIVKIDALRIISKYGAFSLQSYYLHIVFLRVLNYSSDIYWLQLLICVGTVFLLTSMVILSLLALYFVPFSHLLLFGKSYSFYRFEKSLPKILR